MASGTDMEEWLCKASKAKVPCNYRNEFPMPEAHVARVLKNVVDRHPEGRELVEVCLKGEMPPVR